MSRQAGGSGWSLEVVRGREVGRRIPMRPGTAVLGNAVGNGDGIDLSGQEGDSPRRMAGRHAVVHVQEPAPVLRDLESPGGTFVNRRRLLPGQDLALKAGDLIQLGAVQLRVLAPEAGRTSTGAVESEDVQLASGPRAPSASRHAPGPSASPGSASVRGALAFSIKDGPTCRSWDDFLTVSAQRWETLREELTSGRLASYLISTGRAELAPRADAPGSPDDRLDAWLASIPVTRPARPELEAHPRTLTLKGTPGARTRQVVRVSNVGFRLLKSRARVEPADATWLRVLPEFSREFPTVDETEVTVEVAVPDPMTRRLSATIVVESNGGSARVSVSLEPARSKTQESTDASGAIEPGEAIVDVIKSRLAGWLGVKGARVRLIGGAILGVLFRLGIGVAGGMVGVATLPGPALVLATTGAVAGGIWITRRGGPRDAPAGAFSGGFAGLVLASLAVAACQAIEPILGPGLSRNLVAVTALWGALGAMIGGASLLLVRDRGTSRGGSV